MPQHRIKQVRTRKGFTKSRLASKSGLTRQTLHNYETGRTSPRLEEIQKIASALGVEMAELIPLSKSSTLAA